MQLLWMSSREATARFAAYTSISAGLLRISDSGEITLGKQQLLLVRPIEIGAVNRTAEVGNEHSAAFQV